jgi:capsid protein
MSMFRQLWNRMTGEATPPGKQISNAQNRKLMSERMPGIKARFDLQYNNPADTKHWALSDSMSVDASASWMVRRTFRMKSRYEYHNNSYCMGIVDTVANYVIGTGPRLQMATPDKKVNAAIEKAWTAWAKAVKLTKTLKSMRAARMYNGESFALLKTNPLNKNPVKLDVFEVEADQVSSPMFGLYPAQYPDQYFDGVVLDPFGHPQQYHVLRQHPGAFGAFVLLGNEFDAWPARYVLHDYKRIRPGQQRGIPELLPAMPLFAILRRYDLATIRAAETAASYAMTFEHDGSADTDESEGTEPEPFDTIELDSGLATFLPSGWKMHQTKAEHPSTNYEEFVNAILRQISRCTNVPLFIASMDARMANMSSAYVATQPFVKSVLSDREEYNDLLDRVFDEFMTEALRIPGLIPNDTPEAFYHVWRWPKVSNHADPSKTATAQQTRLESGTSSIPIECAEEGLDWEQVQETAAASFGMTVEDYRTALRQKAFAIRGQPSPVTDNPEPANIGDKPTSSTQTDEVDE